MIITGIILFLVLIGTLNIFDSFESDEEFDRSIIDELKDDVYKVLACYNNENHDSFVKNYYGYFKITFQEYLKYETRTRRNSFTNYMTK